MSNQTWNNDPKPEGSGDDSGAAGSIPPSYTPPGADPNQGQTFGYQPPAWNGQQAAPSGTSGAEAPGQGGYQPPSYGAPGQPSYAPSGSEAPGQGGYAPPNYGAPSTPDQTFGQTPSYGSPSQPPYSQPQGGQGQAPSAQTPYGAVPQVGYDPNATGGAFGQPQAPYGAPGGYGAPAPYGAPGSYQPNPYAPAGPQLATWGRRAIGGLVDFVVPAFAISILIGVLMPNGGYGANLISTVLTLGWWAYNTGYRVATTGYSFGQKLGKVRVVMEDTGQTPSQNVAITRALSHFLDSLCLIGFLFPLWDSKKQTFADKIAKTVVIDEQHVQR